MHSKGRGPSASKVLSDCHSLSRNMVAIAWRLLSLKAVESLIDKNKKGCQIGKCRSLPFGLDAESHTLRYLLGESNEQLKDLSS